jgi:hypothetical protein
MLTFLQFLLSEDGGSMGTNTGSVAGIGTGPPDQSEPPGIPKRSTLLRRKKTVETRKTNDRL